MKNLNPEVLVIDDDPSIRQSLFNLLSSAGMHVILFSSAAEYLSFNVSAESPSCLIVDLGLRDINGLDLQEHLGNKVHPPIIFVTGRADVSSSVRAMKAGAIDFLAKPFDHSELLAAINKALCLDLQVRLDKSASTRLEQRLKTLTPREREVLVLVVSGFLNKQSAAHLGISEITLQIHRGKAMKKMGAASLADLVRMADILKIPLHPVMGARSLVVAQGVGAIGKSRAALHSSKNALVAVVDDDLRVLEALELLLEALGHSVCTFSSAAEFLRDPRTSEVNCLISDIGMPKINGFELRKLISDRYVGLPVILMTGRYDRFALEQIGEDGERLLIKPFDSQSLLRSINFAMGTC